MRAHTSAVPFQVLEDRLSDKKEALLEKELVLEEVVSLTKKLRKQATDGRAEALLLSKKVTRTSGERMDGHVNFDTKEPAVPHLLGAKRPCLFLAVMSELLNH